MKILLIPTWRRGRNGFMALLAMLGTSLYAQDAQTTMPAPAQQTQNAPVKLSPDDLNQLLAPIALYPDALIALILPASTVPSDVVLGARYVRDKGDPDQVGNQPWDDSVKSLIRYPDVLQWMDQNLEWTSSLGEAFVNQPADVMDAIQQLRAQAKAKGNLRDTPQQKVVQEDQDIRIIPADPEVIYVPEYDPEVVYYQPYSPEAEFITFGLGFSVGYWLNYDFDWHRHCVYRGDWRGWNNNNYWNGGGGGNTVNVVNINNASQWQPTARSQQQLVRRQQNNGGNARFVNSTTSKNVRTSSATANNVGTATTATGTATTGHHNQLPRPSRLTATNQGAGGNRVPPASANVSGQTQGVTNITPNNLTPAQAGRHGHASPPPAAPSSVSGTSQATTETVNPGGHPIVNTPTATHHGEGRRNVEPTAAPQVSGELGAPSNNTEKAARHDHRTGGTSPQSVQPSAAPSSSTENVSRPAPTAPKNEHVNRPAPSSQGVESAVPHTAPASEAPRIHEPQSAPHQNAPSERPSASESHAVQNQAPAVRPQEHHAAPPEARREQSAPAQAPAAQQTKQAPASSAPSPSKGGNDKKSDKKKDNS